MNQQNKSFKVLGIMSGTSLDGIDLCLVEFEFLKIKWNYLIIKAETLPYSNEWKKKLLKAESCSGEELVYLDVEYGNFLGKEAKEFLNKYHLKVDFISSHGHTIFHQTDRQLTFQLGKGSNVAATAETTTISDFRSLDVALGGQGAPLVPFGDAVLFQQYDCCVNLGGISNLSYTKNERRVAFDVAPMNIVLNEIIRKEFGKEYDDEGKISRSGNFNCELFDQLNQLEYYSFDGPKSLGKEWVSSTVMPVIESFDIATEDKLNTFTKHSAYQLAKSLKAIHINSNILLTGGGTKNLFYMESLKEQGINFTVPSAELVDYKEALIFAFLGVKRLLNENNTLKSVTGARKDSCGGSIYKY